MQYVLLIYQGTNWARLPNRSEDERKSIVAEYAANHQLARCYPRSSARSSREGHHRPGKRRRDAHHRGSVRRRRRSRRRLLHLRG
jgi:hypothetical protein